MSHNVGRIVAVPSTRIGPDGPLAPVSLKHGYPPGFARGQLIRRRP